MSEILKYDEKVYFQDQWQEKGKHIIESRTMPL